MPSQSETPTPLASLLNTLTDTVIWLHPVDDGRGQRLDFLVGYANGTLEYPLPWLPTDPGNRLLDGPGNDTERETFAGRIRQVLDTGVPHEQVIARGDGPGRDQLTCTRLGEGVLVIVRPLPDDQPPAGSVADMAAPQPATQDRQELVPADEPQPVSVQRILDATQTVISVYEPIRDETGQIQDFRVTMTNRAGQVWSQQVGLDVWSRTLGELFPSMAESGLLDSYRQIIDTGQPARFDHYHRELALWARISAAKMGDSIVATSQDVTQNRQLMLDYERQTHFLNTLIEASPNGIVAERAIRDETGTIVDFVFLLANRQAATILQSSVDQIVGQRDLELHPGLRESGVFDTHVRAVETGIPQQIDTYYTDGRLNFWVSVDVRRIATDEIVVTFTDVSLYKKNLLENQRQGELLSNVFGASTNGILSFLSVRDEAGHLIDFTCQIGNEAAGRLVGQPADSLAGSRLLTLLPQADALGLFGLFAETAGTGKPVNTEVHLVHNGVAVWWTVAARKLHDGFVVTFADVTQLRLATRGIEESVHRLQAIIDQSQTAIALLTPAYDTTGEIVNFTYCSVNQTLAGYFDKSPADLVGTPVSQWFTAFLTNGYSFQRYRNVFLTSQPIQFDLHYEGNGLDAWFDVKATRLDNEVLISFSNYTSLKQAQQQLERTVIDLQRSNRNLEQFAYVASHDLQEPLRKIRTFGTILQERYQGILDAEGADLIDRMQSAATRMQTLILDVLAYSRLSTQRDTAGPVPLQAIIDDLQLDLETTISDLHAQLQVGPLPVVQGDSVQLRQLFQNLISNALKFSRPGVIPTVSITCRTATGHDTGLPVTPTDADRLFYQIDVTDNGIGFAPEYAERIFQVFQRLHGRSQYSGTGIGLAIVEKVVDNHHGYIRAEGRPGDGATFRLLLPV